MPNYQHQSSGGIQWNINNLSGDQINIGGSRGGIQSGGNPSDISSLHEIVIPNGTRQVTVNGRYWKVGDKHYTDGTYQTR
jgi:hypothetical protein